METLGWIMEAVHERFFKLSNYPGGLGLSCNINGLALAGVPLLNYSARGFAPRPHFEVQRLLCSAYGANTETKSVVTGLETIARALNAGDIGYACTAAVLLRLPELDWNGAVRIANAEDSLLKYNPDEPRDWHGRWTTSGGGANDDLPVQLLSSPANSDVVDAVTQNAWNAEATGSQDASNPFPLPHDWVSLPPGERIDELGDLLEWIANAKPSDAPAIYDEIDRQYIQNGDLSGALKLAEALSSITKTNPTTADRQAVLDKYEYLTRIDPRDAGQATIDEAAQLMQLGLVPGGGPSNEQAPAEEQLAARDPSQPSEVWKQGWAARGNYFGKALGENLPPTFPVIDNFSDGIVTSIKSIDLNAATYQNGSRLAARLTSYVDKIVDFDGMNWAGESVRSGQIEGRVLSLAVPKGSITIGQRAVIQSVTSAAKSRGVSVIVTEF